MQDILRSLSVAMAATLLLSCSADKQTSDNAVQPTTPNAASQPAVVEIVARGLQFEAPATTPSGWTTLRLRNESQMVHFALVQKLPAGYGLKQQQEQVAPVFQEGMNHLNAGDVDAAMAAFGKIPEWFHQIQFLGGPGLVAGGEVAETTTYLEPGTYLIECYVKTGGVFHSFNPVPGSYGMIAQLEVTADASPAQPPEPSFTLEISAADGIDAPAQLSAGSHIVKVHFADQQAYENFLGHDVHLVQLQSDTDQKALNDWMDWRGKLGLQTPAPARFLGGTNDMPAGREAYLHLDLAPGTYMWIAEVPDPAGKGMAKQFTVN